jgi:hypothetical protein
VKQQSAGRHVAPLGHIIMISSQPVFTITPYLLRGGVAHTNCIVEQELPAIPEHLSLSLILSGVHVAQSLVFCMVFLVGFVLLDL